MRRLTLLALAAGGIAIALSARRTSAIGSIQSFGALGSNFGTALTSGLSNITETLEESFIMVTRLPRGIRNNNPGNIRRGSPWLGRSAMQSDSAFVQFDAPEYGIRALGILLRNYQAVRGLNTVRGIINRYAPPVENDTGSYVNSVANALGVSPDEPINVVANLSRLIPAIIRHENGRQPYTPAQIEAGIALI